jgi:hypothetical protein
MFINKKYNKINHNKKFYRRLMISLLFNFDDTF